MVNYLTFESLSLDKNQIPGVGGGWDLFVKLCWEVRWEGLGWSEHQNWPAGLPPITASQSPLVFLNTCLTFKHHTGTFSTLDLKARIKSLPISLYWHIESQTSDLNIFQVLNSGGQLQIQRPAPEPPNNRVNGGQQNSNVYQQPHQHNNSNGSNYDTYLIMKVGCDYQWAFLSHLQCWSPSSVTTI